MTPIPSTTPAELRPTMHRWERVRKPRVTETRRSRCPRKAANPTSKLKTFNSTAVATTPTEKNRSKRKEPNPSLLRGTSPAVGDPSSATLRPDPVCAPVPSRLSILVGGALPSVFHENVHLTKRDLLICPLRQSGLPHGTHLLPTINH